LCPGRVKGRPQGEGVRVLFIGGSGIISSACSRLAAERDIDLFVLPVPWFPGQGAVSSSPGTAERRAAVTAVTAG